MLKTAMSSVLLVILFVGLGDCQTIPGRWELVDALNSRAQIEISLSSGIRLSGTFQSSTENSIFLVDAAGHLKEIRKADVQRITLVSTVGDTSWNGAAIGAGAGFGIGFLLGGLSGESDEEYPKVGSRVFGPIGAAAGLLLGYLEDKDHKVTREEVIYMSRQE